MFGTKFSGFENIRYLGKCEQRSGVVIQDCEVLDDMAGLLCGLRNIYNMSFQSIGLIAISEIFADFALKKYANDGGLSLER